MMVEYTESWTSACSWPITAVVVAEGAEPKGRRESFMHGVMFNPRHLSTYISALNTFPTVSFRTNFHSLCQIHTNSRKVDDHVWSRQGQGMLISPQVMPGYHPTSCNVSGMEHRFPNGADSGSTPTISPSTIFALTPVMAMTYVPDTHRNQCDFCADRVGGGKLPMPASYQAQCIEVGASRSWRGGDDQEKKKQVLFNR